VILFAHTMRGALAAFLLVGMGVVVPLGDVWAGAPQDQLRIRVDQVTKTLGDQGLKARPQARRQELRRIADETFDFAESAKRSLGRHWQILSADERLEFVKLYAELLQRSYISKSQLWDGERVEFLGETLEVDHAVVRSRITTRARSEIPMDFKLLRKGQRWLAYDVVIEGVSLIDNYQKQFNKIIQTESFEALKATIRRKITDAGD
jgi:phospholipid transport system substrate-binding protein